MTVKKPDPQAVLHYTGFEQTEALLPPPDAAAGSSGFFAVTGAEAQVLTVRLPEGGQLRGEPGSMFYLSAGMAQRLACDACWSRCCTGEDCCVVDMVNEGAQPGYAALTPSFPMSKVVPVDLRDPNVGGTLIAQKGAFFASYGEVQIQIDLDCNFVRCCCGGMGLIRQRIVGTGTAFLSSTGTMVQKVLKAGETILVDTWCLLAYAGTCTFTIKRVGGVLGMVGGGEGIFNTSITGPGLVIISSMNAEIFRQALAAPKLYRR